MAMDTVKPGMGKLWLSGPSKVQNLTGGSVQYWIDVECWVKKIK